MGKNVVSEVIEEILSRCYVNALGWFFRDCFFRTLWGLRNRWSYLRNALWTHNSSQPGPILVRFSLTNSIFIYLCVIEKPKKVLPYFRWRRFCLKSDFDSALKFQRCRWLGQVRHEISPDRSEFPQEDSKTPETKMLDKICRLQQSCLQAHGRRPQFFWKSYLLVGKIELLELKLQ